MYCIISRTWVLKKQYKNILDLAWKKTTVRIKSCSDQDIIRIHQLQLKSLVSPVLISKVCYFAYLAYFQLSLTVCSCEEAFSHLWNKLNRLNCTGGPRTAGLVDWPPRNDLISAFNQCCVCMMYDYQFYKYL